MEVVNSPFCLLRGLFVATAVREVGLKEQRADVDLDLDSMQAIKFQQKLSCNRVVISLSKQLYRFSTVAHKWIYHLFLFQG